MEVKYKIRDVSGIDQGMVIPDDSTKIVVRAFNRLSEEQKLPIMLVFYKGLTYPEAAKKLNLSVETVQDRIHLGLQELRNRIKQRAP